MDLVLASTSPYRRLLLERLGVPFRCVAPEVDEDLFKSRRLSPRLLAETLARAKADSVADRHRDSLVIGSDQVVCVDDQILGKPGTIDQAIAQLSSLSGRSHELITAMSIRHPSGSRDHINVTTMRMRTLSSESLRRYVEDDRPLDCAGSYKIESRGIMLFDGIETDDHSAIVGLPLIALTTILRELGLDLP